MKRLRPRTAPTHKLYWCTSPDHWEDWFVIAPSSRIAKSFFAEVNGYSTGDVTTKLVASPSPETAGEYNSKVGFAENEDIGAYGGKVILNNSPRVASIKGQMYREGSFEGMPGIETNMRMPEPGEDIHAQCVAAISTLNAPAPTTSTARREQRPDNE